LFDLYPSSAMLEL